MFRLDLTAGCGCAGSRIRPRAVMHELGHAFGYYHTDSQTDVMYGTILSCDLSPSDYPRACLRRRSS